VSRQASRLKGGALHPAVGQDLGDQVSSYSLGHFRWRRADERVLLYSLQLEQDARLQPGSPHRRGELDVAALVQRVQRAQEVFGVAVMAELALAFQARQFDLDADELAEFVRQVGYQLGEM
jgi:hypothetical protein